MLCECDTDDDDDDVRAGGSGCGSQGELGGVDAMGGPGWVKVLLWVYDGCYWRWLQTLMMSESLPFLLEDLWSEKY